MRFEIKMPFKIPRNKLGHLKGCICPKCPDYDPVIVRFSNVDWYVKRPLELPTGTEWEIWCMICYGREVIPDLYDDFLNREH